MRKSDAKGVFVQVAQKDKKATVTLDAVNLKGSYLNEADTDITIIEPQGGETHLKMTQTAPGRYLGEFDASKTGTYHIQMLQKVNGAMTTQQSRALVVNYDDELRLRPTDEKLLQAVAEVSGGAYRPDPTRLFDASDRTATRPIPLWPYLVIAAALIFLIDVALRRIDFALLFGKYRPATVGRFEKVVLSR